MSKTKRTEQKSIRVTLSDDEWKKLDLICEDTGLDKSNVIRQLIKRYEVKKSNE
jgi:predicted transcriptional regulator